MSICKTGLLLLLTTTALTAQEGQPPAAKAVRPWVEISLSTEAGTLARFVDKLRAAAPKANIVVAAAAADVQLPPIDLRSAGIAQALEAACAVAEGPVQVRMVEFKGVEPVYSLVALPGNPATAVPVSQKADEGTVVFSLNSLTDADPRANQTPPFKVETILSAIEAATSDDQKPPPPVLRYHRDSGVLFVRGSRQQVTLVRDLLQSLGRDLDERRQRNRPAKEAPKEAAKDEPKPKEAK